MHTTKALEDFTILIKQIISQNFRIGLISDSIRPKMRIPTKKRFFEQNKNIQVLFQQIPINSMPFLDKKSEYPDLLQISYGVK